MISVSLFNGVISVKKAMKIYSQKKTSEKILKVFGTFYIFAFILLFISEGKSILSLNTLIQVSAFFVILLFIWGVIFLIFLRGRKIEIDANCVNIGRSYVGPFTSMIEKYQFPKYNKAECLISWSSIRSICYINWERSWASGVVGYFLSIETKDKQYFFIEMNTLMMRESKEVITRLGHGGLIDENIYKI
jgi:hypothetical protein